MPQPKLPKPLDTLEFFASRKTPHAKGVILAVCEYQLFSDAAQTLRRSCRFAIKHAAWCGRTRQLRTVGHDNRLSIGTKCAERSKVTRKRDRPFNT